MDSYLEQLCGHSAWSDSEHWNAIEAHPLALEDAIIRERVLHIHLVQHAFLWTIGARNAQFSVKELTDFPNMSDLKLYGQQYHREVLAMLTTLSARTEEVIEIPWSNPPLKINVAQALIQSAMRSHYHRGQNATRLRELGGMPPNTDFILWVRRGRPIP